MCVAPCSWRTRISLIFESTSASKIGIAAPPDSPKMYSTPSRSRQRMRASAPVCALTGTGGAAAGLVSAGAGTVLSDRGADEEDTSEPHFLDEGRQSYGDLAHPSRVSG